MRKRIGEKIINPQLPPQILPPIQTKISEKPRKTIKRESSNKEFFQDMKDAKFRGAWIFASRELFNKWMMEHSDRMLKLGGTFNTTTKCWHFPWGARLNLVILAKGEDVEALRGFRFSNVEIDGKIDEDIQQNVVALISRFIEKKV